MKSKKVPAKMAFPPSVWFLPIWLLVLNLIFPPLAVLALPEGALGWDDPHQLQQGDGGHHDDHLLGGNKWCILFPELFSAN